MVSQSCAWRFYGLMLDAFFEKYRFFDEKSPKKFYYQTVYRSIGRDPIYQFAQIVGGRIFGYFHLLCSLLRKQHDSFILIYLSRYYALPLFSLYHLCLFNTSLILASVYLTRFSNLRPKIRETPPKQKQTLKQPKSGPKKPFSSQNKLKCGAKR